jgi:hypothetical protein
MTPARLVSAEQAAFRRFADAVRAVSDDPGPENVVRYLLASRALEESRPTPPRARRRTARASRLGSGAVQLRSQAATAGDLP